MSQSDKGELEEEEKKEEKKEEEEELLLLLHRRRYIARSPSLSNSSIIISGYPWASAHEASIPLMHYLT